MTANPIKLAVLVSGSGTTLQNLIDRIGSGDLAAEISLVIGSRSELIGLQRARDAALPHAVVDRKLHPDCADFSRQVFERVDEAKVDLVCLAGWLCLLEIPPRYSGRVMNIHPALLPAFGGKGMYGNKVHEAVLAHGCKVSGCTVHFVDGAYDSGPIILQRCCAVLENDSPQTLARQVFEEEKIAYPQAITLFAQDRLKIEGRNVRVLPR